MDTEHVSIYLEHYVGDPMTYSYCEESAPLIYTIEDETHISQGCGYTDQYHLGVF